MRRESLSAGCLLLAALVVRAPAQSAPALGAAPRTTPVAVTTTATTTSPPVAPLVLPPGFDRLRPVPVFWVIGQSNAEGATAGYWLRASTPAGPRHPELAVQPDVKIWWPGHSPTRPTSPARWEGYVTGEIATAINNAAYFITENTFGTEASLGHGLRKRLGEPVWIFKFTKVAALYPAAQPSWSKSAAPGGLYDSMIAEWHRAADALRAQGLAPDVRGLFWLQGEGDRGPNNTWAQQYETNLRRFITDLRADLAGDTGADDGPLRAPFVIAALHPNHQPPSFWDAAEAIIRTAEQTVALADKRVVYVETSQITLDKSSPNWVHFDGAGYVQLGYEFADAWWQLERDR